MGGQNKATQNRDYGVIKIPHCFHSLTCIMSTSFWKVQQILKKQQQQQQQKNLQEFIKKKIKIF